MWVGTFNGAGAGLPAKAAGAIRAVAVKAAAAVRIMLRIFALPAAVKRFLRGNVGKLRLD
jgi:hypothetical protein